MTRKKAQSTNLHNAIKPVVILSEAKDLLSLALAKSSPFPFGKLRAMMTN